VLDGLKARFYLVRSVEAAREAGDPWTMWTIHSYLLAISHFMRASFPPRNTELMVHTGHMGHSGLPGFVEPAGRTAMASWASSVER
jgi:hypothetical protein